MPIRQLLAAILLAIIILVNPIHAYGACSGVDTAIGCISTDYKNGGFASDILKISVGLGGGFALLLILYGIFIITSSAGIPEKLQQGQEIITSAVVGLIMIIMSIVLLNLIGVKILAIPGL